jgi:tetratricopeptide (TPR) repeat protein
MGIVRMLVVIGVFTLVCASSIYAFELKPDSAKGRMLIYRICLNMFLDHPLIGSGFGKFPYSYNLYQSKYFLHNPNSSFIYLAESIKVAFSEYFQILVEQGIIGFLIFIWGAFVIFKVKKGNHSVLTIKVVFCAVLICSLFSYPLQSLKGNIHLLILLSLIASSETLPYNLRIKRNFFLIVLTTTIVCYCFYRLSFTVADFTYRQDWRKAYEADLFRSHEETEATYQRLYIKLKYDPYFLYNYGTLLLHRHPKEGIRVLQEAEKLLTDNELLCDIAGGFQIMGNKKMARHYYKKAIHIVPNRFEPRFQLFEMYLEDADIDSAIYVACEIQNLKVKVPSARVDTIKKRTWAWLRQIKPGKPIFKDTTSVVVVAPPRE